MTGLLSRRLFAAGGMAIALGGVAPFLSFRTHAVQGGMDLTSLGLPRLDMTLSNDAYEQVPFEIEAGRYLVNVDILHQNESYIGTEFISPPPGMSALEFMVLMGLIVIEAIPAPTPAEGEEGFPAFVYETIFAGGPAGLPGATAQAVVDFVPGEWIVLSDGEGATQPPVVFTVRGEMPTTLAEPKADITATLVDFGISVAGDLTAGEHVMLLRNEGLEPHFLLLGTGPETMTDELVGDSLEMPPEASGFDLQTDVTMVMLSSTQSVGTQQWVPVTLDAGNYVGTCYFPTAGGWDPHVNHGMHTVFTVD